MNTAAKTVLIVDDDPDVANSVRRVLDRRGLRTLLAGSVPEGLVALQSPEKIDLVLLDLDLPGVSGLALLKALRDQGREDLPVVIMSGTGTIEDVIEALRNRAADYLRKPFFPEQLTAAVDRILDAPAPIPKDDETGGATSSAEIDLLLNTIERQQVSNREKQVLGLLLQGRRAPEMATALQISPHTVRNHLKALYKKLGVHSQGALAEFLLERKQARRPQS
jgi:two-component system, NarL family, nitrate/nitrite response regulator NarL